MEGGRPDDFCKSRQRTLKPPWFTLLYFFLIFYCSCYYSCPNFPPFDPSTQHPRTPSGNPHTVVHVHGPCIYVLWLIPSPSFNQSPPPTSPLPAVSLFHVSVPLILFCLLILFIRFHIQVRSCGICVSLTGLLLLTLNHATN